MSTRGRRARGRPPKTPVSTNRTNFLRKPKAYQNLNSNVNSTDSPSPLSHYRTNRSDRGRGRAAHHKGRQFLSQLAAEDDELSSLPEFENDRASDFTDIDNTDIGIGGSDVSFDGESDDDGGISDNESLSTVSSSVSKKKLLIKRPKTPEIPDDKDIPALNLPASATDLLFPVEHILQAVGIYEVIRHFRKILRLSPFVFEDFCAALISDEQNTLLSELFITLLKALFREDESSSTTFGPQDTKDSVNVSLFFMDYMTWPEIVRAFLDSEKHPEYRAHLSVVESQDFPYVSYVEKLKVLQTLTDLFLATTKVREEIINEGNIHYDDHCRACHKLGDLLCCETCSAVYHLACVEPPMEEVPEDDWICSVCRAHQVKGVTDCVSEAEKSGLLSRQEPIGYDRQARKYWFLCRRIIVEGEKECYYYSTKCQLEELLESLEPAWEADLISFINEMRDDILKQMTFSEELTLARKGSKKSVIEIENAQLSKIQAERAAKKAKEEEERKAEEEKKRAEEEEKKRLEEEKRDNPEKEDDDESLKKDDSQDSDNETSMVEEISESVTSSKAVITSESEEFTSEKKDDANGTKEITETTTTTTVTTVTSTTKTISTLMHSKDGDVDDADEDNDEPASKKVKLDQSDVGDVGDNRLSENNKKDNDQSKPDDSGDGTSNRGDGKIVVSATSALAEAIKSTGDGKQKVISLASLLPGTRQGILNSVEKSGEDGKSEGGQTKTVLLVNREGGKVTLQVQRQPVSKENDPSKISLTQTSTSINASTSESRKMLTRSKTGSLTPKLFTDSITMTTNTGKLSGKASDETLVINKDGETTRFSRSKVSLSSSSVQQSIHYKLGGDNVYKQYQNQYTINTLALNKHQHNEERDKRRHLSHKFSLTQTSEFKWNGNLLGNRLSMLATLRLTISSLESNIQAPFMHSNWSSYKQHWQKAVQICQTPRDFGLALCVLEACTKPCVFNTVWHESLGHVRLYRITVSDREEWKKKEKEQRRRKEDEDEVRPLVWIKYTLGLKHQIWKLKGEEYRVTGGNGWKWISATRNFKDVPQDTVGLRSVAGKMRFRRLKTAKANQSLLPNGEDDMKVDSESNENKEDKDATAPMEDESMEVDNREGESMEVDNKDNENKVDNDLKLKDSDVKVESVEMNGELEDDVKSEAKMDLAEGEKVDDSTEKVDCGAKVKEEVVIADEVEKKPVVKKTTRQKRLDGIYKDFICFMKNKYTEDEDMVHTLELLKKHPEKVDAEVVNVSEALQKRTYYPKVTKPYSKLDGLLERRMKQDELERKQRLTIETQIALKQKLSEAIETAKRKKEAEKKKKLEESSTSKLVNGDIRKDVDSESKSSEIESKSSESESKLSENESKSSKSESKSSEMEKSSPNGQSLPYSCYSVACRTSKDDSSSCYSPLCRNNSIKAKALEKEKDDAASSKQAETNSDDSSNRSSKEGSPDENVEVSTEKEAVGEEKKDESNKEADESGENEDEGSPESAEKEGKDEKENDEEGEKDTKESSSSTQMDMSTEDEEVDIEGDNKDSSTLMEPSKTTSLSDKTNLTENESKPESSTKEVSVEKNPEVAADSDDSSSSNPKPAKNASVSEVVKNLVIKTMAEKAIRSPSEALSTAVANISIEELKAKLPAKRSTSDKVKLPKSLKMAKKANRGLKNGRLPTSHRFETTSGMKSILLLDRNELHKLARLGAKRESQMFNYNCKMNNVCWPYPCPRPYFKTGWRYRTMTLSSLSAAALQLRTIWACLRWDDMAAKPPAGGTNTISTETEITTTELLKRREVGTDGLRSEFLVRKIVVPLGVPDKPKEKYTPQRSGLRERKRAEAVRQTEPSVTEVWVPEEVLELWEIKQFGEKLEKQRQALQEKAKEATASQQATVTSQQTATQIKAQMEQQLKQQRLALAQKRIQESQGIKITTTASPSPSLSSSNSTTIIINNASKPGSTFKTLTVSSPSSLLPSGILKTMQQPKTIIANAGSLLSGQLRPGIRVQLPGSAIQLRPQTVTLAPKPGGSTVTPSGVSTITRLISPSPPTRNISPATPQPKTQTIQIRPQNAGQPVQNLQFIQQPNGQLQVKGLLPGQIIQRMPDGKLQIISLNSSAAAAAAPSSSSSATSSSPLTTALQSQPRPANISIRPQQTIMVTIPGSSSTTSSVNATAGTQNRLVIPAQLATSIALSQVSGSPSTITLPTARPVLGGTVISSTPQKHMIITRPGGSAQVLGTAQGATPAASSGTSALNSAVIISAPSIINAAAAASGGSSTATVLVNSQQSQAVLTPAGLVNVQGNTNKQTLISTLRPVLASNAGSQSISTIAGTTTTTASSLLTGQVLSGTSLLPRPNSGTTSLLNLPTASGGSLTLAAAGTSTSQIPKLLTSPPVGAQIIRPVGSTQAQLVIRPGSTLLTGGTQAKVITAQQLKGLTSATPIQLKPATSMSPIKTILSPPSSNTLLLPASKSSAVQSLASQLALQQASGTPQQNTLITMPKQTVVSSAVVSGSSQGLTPDGTSTSAPSGLTSPTPGSSPSAGVPKYAITPQVVEQVVRQALLQNQTPEIQQKLLAMQRQIQQQRTTSSPAPSSSVGIITLGSTTPSSQRIAQTNIITPTTIRTVPVAASSESRTSKSKGMTPEQKEEQSRNSVCSQVMKNMLDRIEREEKQEQRNKKKQESAEEKQKRLAVMNQQKWLFKHKEALKKEILRKRSLMEKNLQQDIYTEMAEKVKRAKLAQGLAKSPTPGSTAHVATPVTLISKKAALKDGPKLAKEPSPAEPKQSSAARKRKQKIISTGIKSLNPKEKLFCVCKTPYDDTRFYIGCDLCSNWFHGVCVNINEDQAKFIDSYICEDCRKQQENTSEELYCLCRTPYDENQFYIGCDRCQDWFHGYCVGISKNEADSIDVYVCPRCQKEESADPIAQRSLNQSEYQHLIKLVKDVKVHKMAWPFLNPVDPREVPDYYNIIAEPMDLTIVEDKLSTRSYEKLNDFVKDITKIFDNCRFYNPVGTPYYQCAEVVETYFAQKIKALRGANKL